MRPKTIEPHFSSTSTTTRSCIAKGCDDTTREGKPYCPEHVDLNEYVVNILGILAERKAEQNRVRVEGPSAVNPKGLTSKELILHLSQHGSRTVERLSREFQLDTPVMHYYVNALLAQGKVVLGRTTRGSTVVRLAS